MKQQQTIRAKANEYTVEELKNCINLKKNMIAGVQSAGFDKKSPAWEAVRKGFNDFVVQCAKKRYENALIELNNLERMLKYKKEMQEIQSKYPHADEDKAYFLWSFTKKNEELFLEQTA